MKFSIDEGVVRAAIGHVYTRPLELAIARKLRMEYAIIADVFVNMLTARVSWGDLSSELNLTYSIKMALSNWAMDGTPPIGEWDLDNDSGNFNELVGLDIKQQG